MSLKQWILLYLKLKRCENDRRNPSDKWGGKALEPDTDSAKDLLLFRQDLDGAVHAGQIPVMEPIITS